MFGSRKVSAAAEAVSNFDRAPEHERARDVARRFLACAIGPRAAKIALSEIERAPVKLRTLLIAAVAVHVIFVIVRVPHSVFGRRSKDISDHAERGAVRFHLDNKHRQGAAAVEWILANVPEDGVVLSQGELRGALEFVPVLIWPRLLVRSAVPKSAREFAGRPIARRRREDGHEGQVVLIGLGDALELAVR